MYGSIFRMRLKRGKQAELVSLMEEWDSTQRRRAEGFVATFVFKPDAAQAGDVTGVAVFADKQSYLSNANDPKQDQWYRKMRALLSADPVWEDGEVIAGKAKRV